jgi:AcrR family transcriptional regulator
MATAQATVGVDRRHRRRQETMEEVLDVAVAVMREQGVAGLSLGEVARRMGIRPPSLYVYYESKNALYDGIFARGWRELIETMEPLEREVDEAPDLPALMHRNAEMFVRWSIAHPAYAQLMFWRPVPNYEPSEDAYAPALEMWARSVAMFRKLQLRGLFDPDADAQDVLRTWTVLISGVISQQLANAPDETFECGVYTSLLPELVDMYLARHGRRTRINPKRRRP